MHCASAETAMRFIPAWAGNTIQVHQKRVNDAVHPRVGGEHTCIAGKLDIFQRFIPAWAGNTTLPDHGEKSRSVHPRVGGEHAQLRDRGWMHDGSSPRGRGTHRIKPVRLRGIRFIPAWAGNTPVEASKAAKSTVHPRVGGEHYSARSRRKVAFGSSPRGRGTRSIARQGMDARRFIPAWAGNTHKDRPGQFALPVHPRVGGEHILASNHLFVASGSSPRGRGTLRLASTVLLRIRFIPAWAGNTRGDDLKPRTLTVHPRVGGEHVSAHTHRVPVRGSSPRGRGTPDSESGAPRIQPVHPRVGGEHSRRRRRYARGFGSSPRGRGTQSRLNSRSTV